MTLVDQELRPTPTVLLVWHVLLESSLLITLLVNPVLLERSALNLVRLLVTLVDVVWKPPLTEPLVYSVLLDSSLTALDSANSALSLSIPLTLELALVTLARLDLK